MAKDDQRYLPRRLKHLRRHVTAEDDQAAMSRDAQAATE